MATKAQQLAPHYSVRHVAERLDMSVQWVKKQIKHDRLKAFRLGQRVVIEAESLSLFLENRQISQR